MDCPGRFKCHGPASWCEECGDVDLTCDDPACMAHDRGEERWERLLLARIAHQNALTAARETAKELEDASRRYWRWKIGPGIMVGREQPMNKAVL